ncbi:MAG: DUF4265 domain-containing protein [Alphaproteobacteria bacterium]|nr:DUF4265 domain-containing protein [Alphaproteobacteria bacterium]
MDKKLVKVLFNLEVDEGGWPPTSVETLWAYEVAPELYKIDNIPFFVPFLAYNDTVKVEVINEELVAQKIIDTENHSTFRIYFEKEESFAEICESLVRLGCKTESGNKYKHITVVDVPPNTSFISVKTYLEELEQRGVIIYEEPCISEHHNNEI